MELTEYIAPLRKWWWLILIATGLAGLSSYLVTRQQVPVYRSSTTLMVGNVIAELNPSSAGLSTARQLATTYIDIAKGQTLRRDAQDALGLNRLPRDVVISQTNDNIINITVSDTDPVRAQAVAGEIARQLILRTPGSNEDDQFVEGLLAGFELSIRETQAQIEAKQEELASLTSARDISTAQSELSQLEGTINQLLSDYTSLRATTQQGASNTISYVEQPSLPRQPIDPQNSITILTAAAIAFLLSASAAYVLEYLDDTIKTASNITKLTELPTLAGIAEIRNQDNKLITMLQPRSPTSEAFRVLRTGIQFAAVDETNGLLLVTSATPGDGKSTTAANLAVVMAQAGRNVLLIDSDLRRPTQHRVFDLPNKRGLTNLLLEFTVDEAEEAIQEYVNQTVQTTRIEGLVTMTSGPIPPNPSELLGSAKMQRLLEVLAHQFDFVILDSPPVLSVTDAAVLSVTADSTLMVVRANKSRKQHVRRAVEKLREVNASLAGCVINGLTRSSDGYDFYYYYRAPYYAEKTDDGADGGDGEPPKSRFGSLKDKLLRRQVA